MNPRPRHAGEQAGEQGGADRGESAQGRVDGGRVSGGDGTPGDRDGFATRAIHVGSPPDPATGAIIAPIYQTSTFVQDSIGRHHGYEYARTANPTRTALETCLASLEGVEEKGHGGALAFASGMAATSAVLQTLRPGDRLVLSRDAYGGTHRVAEVFTQWGVVVQTQDLTDLSTLESTLAAGRGPGVVWVESPTNPLLDIVDIAAVSAASHRAGLRCVVDNTFATPYLQQPLRLGADAVVHSVTKYLGGHSDVVGGALITNDDDLLERLTFLRNALGPVPSAFDCWLTLRGVKTLAVRMRAHCDNARAIATYLTGHPEVAQVRYPGLASHPNHATARAQMRDFGGMVSFRLRSGIAAARRVVESTRLFALAESLGGVESLIELPGAMTHAWVADGPFAVPDDLVRLSVGIEDATDLIADLDQALRA